MTDLTDIRPGAHFIAPAKPRPYVATVHAVLDLDHTGIPGYVEDTEGRTWALAECRRPEDDPAALLAEVDRLRAERATARASVFRAAADITTQMVGISRWHRDTLVEVETRLRTAAAWLDGQGVHTSCEPCTNRTEIDRLRSTVNALRVFARHADMSRVTREELLDLLNIE